MVNAAGADVALPGLMICRLAGSLYYANAESLMNEVLSLVETHRPLSDRLSCGSIPLTTSIAWPRKCLWSWLTGWQGSKWH